jgi:hypothetical protein
LADESCNCYTIMTAQDSVARPRGHRVVFSGLRWRRL